MYFVFISYSNKEIDPVSIITVSRCDVDYLTNTDSFFLLQNRIHS